MKHGLARLADIPLSVRLILEIHKVLLQGVRGGERTPGEFRNSQNWIGPAGSTLETAEFVPPPPHEMADAVSNLEQFLHDRESYPDLIHAGIVHAQFETIHPFLDGNGRIGRLLITLLLCERRILQEPLLYLSYFFKARRLEYYERLTAVRHDGDWEGWLKFFLRGVYEVSQAATATSRAILELRERHHELVGTLRSPGNGHRLLDLLFLRPLFSVRTVEAKLDVSYATASIVVDEFEKAGIVEEFTGQRRNRRYRYAPYLDLLEHQLDDQDEDEDDGEFTF